jgi:hypothetical protein
MTMRDTWVRHHRFIWKIIRGKMLVDQAVLEALAVIQDLLPVVNVIVFCKYCNKSSFGFVTSVTLFGSICKTHGFILRIMCRYGHR